jgi:hypothetical protein
MSEVKVNTWTCDRCGRTEAMTGARYGDEPKGWGRMRVVTPPRGTAWTALLVDVKELLGAHQPKPLDQPHNM